MSTCSTLSQFSCAGPLTSVFWWHINHRGHAQPRPICPRKRSRNIQIRRTPLHHRRRQVPAQHYRKTSNPAHDFSTHGRQVLDIVKGPDDFELFGQNLIRKSADPTLSSQAAWLAEFTKPRAMFSLDDGTHCSMLAPLMLVIMKICPIWHHFIDRSGKGKGVMTFESCRSWSRTYLVSTTCGASK